VPVHGIFLGLLKYNNGAIMIAGLQKKIYLPLKMNGLLNIYFHFIGVQ